MVKTGLANPLNVKDFCGSKSKPIADHQQDLHKGPRALAVDTRIMNELMINFFNEQYRKYYTIVHNLKTIKPEVTKYSFGKIIIDGMSL